MSNNLDNALAEIINKAASGVDDAVIFISGQIPDVVSQVLLFELTWNLLISSISLFSFLFFAFIAKKGFKEEFGKSELNIEAATGGVSLSLISLIFFVLYMEEVLKIWIAPKIFLIEYAADLVK